MSLRPPRLSPHEPPACRGWRLVRYSWRLVRYKGRPAGPAFLTSPMSAYVTGENIDVDGGLLALFPSERGLTET